MSAVIYARFSSHAQNEASIEGQLKVCYDYAEKHGFKVVGEYIDRALSARTDDRPEFLRMVEDAKKKHFEYILVYKLDRFSRNRYDSAIYKYNLKQSGVKVLSVMEHIGDNPESIILEAVLEASAEYYSIDLSQKVTRGMELNAEKGNFNGGVVPYGYKSVDGKLELDPKWAPIMKYFLESYAKGIPRKEIIDEINRRGYRNRRGNEFSASSFRHALKNKIYMGVLEWDGNESKCPAIITKEVFEENQVRLAANRRSGAKNKTKVDFSLTGKIFCGLCGLSMAGASGTGGSGITHYYYSCRGRKNKRSGCEKDHERKDYLEWYIVEQTVKYVLDPNRIKTIAESVVAEYDKDFNDGEVTALERQIAGLERDVESCVDMLIDAPEKARARLYERIETMETQRVALEIDLQKLKIANNIRLTKEEVVAWLKIFCQGEPCDEDFRERITDVFINSIYLYDDKIVIFYNIKGGKQVSHIGLREHKKDEPTEELIRILDDMVSHPRLERGTPGLKVRCSTD